LKKQQIWGSNFENSDRGIMLIVQKALPGFWKQEAEPAFITVVGEGPDRTLDGF
jgi:hypothetical protein